MSVVQHVEIDGRPYSIIEAKFRYLLPQDVLKWGEFEIHFPDGSVWGAKHLTELYDCLSAIAWADPQEVKTFLEQNGRDKWLEALRAKQRQLMTQHHGAERQTRTHEPSEQHDAKHIRAEDLDL